jgi:ABC-2 type transport system permease protein
MSEGTSPYLRVLHQQMLNSLAKLMSFRLNFVLSMLFDVAAFATFYYTTDFLFLHISHIGTWNRENFLFYIFWLQSVNAIHAAIVAPNFWNFAAEIRDGNLDFRLLRPLGSLFDVFTAMTRPVTLLTTPFILGFVIYYGIQLHVSVMGWVMMPFLWFFSLICIVLIEVMISMGLLWTKGGDGINFVRIHCQQFQRWPDFVYPDRMRWVFTRIIPFLAAVTFPVRAVIGEGAWWEIPFLCVSMVGLWFMTRWLWTLGLRRYESASS